MTTTRNVKVEKRQAFLEIFLRLFGVDQIVITEVNDDKFYGVANYIGDEEGQDFCWYMTEESVPSDDVSHLIKVIKDNQFNRADKLVVSADTIFVKSGWAEMTRFKSALDKLFDIQVRMIDDGEETDSYFIHD